MARNSSIVAFERPVVRVALGVLVFAAMLVAIASAWYQPWRFTDYQLLGGLVLLEILGFLLWNFTRWFYTAVVLSFLGLALTIPGHTALDAGRWVLLGVGAAVGWATLKNGPFWRFGTFHLVATFCIVSAVVSSVGSPFPTVALAKAGSLFLLFCYAATGARLAAAGREAKFLRGLVLGLEIMVYLTAASYFLLGLNVFDNGNNLGTAMSVGAFPVLLWAFLASQGRQRTRMLIALLTCCALLLYSLERAGILAAAVVALVWCLALRRYRLIAKAAFILLFALALSAVFRPARMQETVTTFTDAMLHKGKRETSILESRRSTWDTAMSDIKAHPFFGTGYGVSPQGNLSKAEVDIFHSSWHLSRENGSSYLKIVGWVGLLGLIPFVALLFLVVRNIFRACRWVTTHGNPYHYSIPLAMVLVAGLVHAGFEDWLFAVGFYASVYFWTLAFILVDLLPPSRTKS